MWLLVAIGCTAQAVLDVPRGPADPPADTGAWTAPPPAPWDASPPDAPRGSILRMQVECGLLQGAPVREFRKTSDGGQVWEMLLPDAPDVHPEVLPCTAPSDDYLEWFDDGRLEVLAGGLWHELSPTTTADRWGGTTWPVDGSTPECDASIAQLGLAWPVSLAMSLVEIVPP